MNRAWLSVDVGEPPAGKRMNKLNAGSRMFPRKVDHEDPFLAVWRLISSGNALLGITSGLSPIRTLPGFQVLSE